MYLVPAPIACMLAAVRMDVGASAFARMPFARSDCDTARMSATTPLFAAAYAATAATFAPGSTASEAK